MRSDMGKLENSENQRQIGRR